MRVLITGVTGFVGMHLALLCQQRGDQVLGVSRTAKWRVHPEALQQWQPPAVLAWDITSKANASITKRIFDFQPDIIFHLAAVSVPADCGASEPTDQAYATNVKGTAEVIDVVRSLPNAPLLMLASSCHVYGPPGETDVVDETAPLVPNNGYGKTKLAAEQLFRQSIEAGYVKGWIARGFQQTGPWQSARLLLPEWSRQFVQRLDPVKVRAIDTTLDMMDVRDSVAAYHDLSHSFLQSASSHPSVLNIGTGERRHGEEIIQALSTAAGYQPRVKSQDERTHRNPIADVSRLQECLPDFHVRNFQETVQDTYNDWKTRDR